MFRKVFLLLVLAICFSFGNMPSFAKNDSYLYKVAVLPFDDSSIQNRWWANEWNVGKGIADMFVTELLNTKRFKVVEREQIDKILHEQKFGLSGVVDSSSASELGRVLGVDYLIIGKVTEFTNDSSGAIVTDTRSRGLAYNTTTARAAIDVRMVDTSTAEIKSGVTGIGEKKNTNLSVATDSGALAFGGNDFLKTNLGIALRDAVCSAVNQLTVKAYEGFSISGIIAYVDPKRVIIDAGAEKGVQPGMVFEVVRIIKEVIHPTTKEVLDQITETIGEITVVEVKEKSANCTVTSKVGEFKIADHIRLKKQVSVPTEIVKQQSAPVPSVPTVAVTPQTLPVARLSLNQMSRGQALYTQFSFFYERNYHVTTNYRKGILVPVNTMVKFVQATGRIIVVTLPNGQNLTIENIEAFSGEKIEGIFTRTFSTTPVNLSQFTDIEKKAIMAGTAVVGMKKAAVLVALGYPPKHKTPDLKKNQWLYWLSRFDTLLVHFENDQVVKIQS